MTGVDGVLRRLGRADAPAYRALMLGAYEQHPDAYTSTVSERAALPLVWWEQRLTAEPWPAPWVVGAFDAGPDGAVLAGAAGLSFEARTRTRHKATLFGMIVQPQARRSGVGTAMVRCALAQARSQPQLALVQLTVTQGNAAAQRLYERCGFSVYGVEPMAVARHPDAYASKLLMWCPLRAAGASEVMA